VYFIYEAGCFNKFKIGNSINPEKRLKSLQTGNSRILKIYKTIPCVSKKYSENLEGAMHIHYLSSCQGGEWFSITPEDIDQCIAVAKYMSDNDFPACLFEDVWKHHHSQKKHEIPYIPVV
jgi:hypothetical protein